MINSWLPRFKHQDIEILSETNMYSGYCAVKQCRYRFRLFRGGISGPVIRDILCRPAAVAVLLYDLIQDKVVMIEQIRSGALNDSKSPWLLEIVAGVIDPGETPESTAQREAKEEANCDILSLRPIMEYYASPGISNEITYVYCGLIRLPNSSIQTTSHHGLLEDGEDIKSHILSSDEAFALLNQGIINSASAIIALQWLALNRTFLNSSL